MALHKEHMIDPTSTAVDVQDSHLQADVEITFEDADATQLQRWAYEVSTDNLTIAERLEKLNWESTRSQKL
jgi:hypothetical protein